MEQRTAVVVGARCAGSTLGIALARQGWDVTIVDRDEFPSDTLSTHLIYPNTVARFDELGILDTFRASHELPMLEFKLIGLGHEIAGTFTPIGGFDKAIAPRRVALDKAILDTALAAGVEPRFGEGVAELIGSGTEEDPVAGVVLEGGEEIAADWVFGADGRASTMASKLGIEKTNPMAGGVSYLLAYWQGLPNDGFATSDIRRDAILSRWAGEDGTHLITAWGDPEFSRGSQDERRAKYLEVLSSFPESLDPAELERAEMISDVLVAPESLMRGYFRKPAGPGWALVGDSCHFKHPGTAQGIGDAVQQAIHVADGVSGADPRLKHYEEWRDARASQHYEWSFVWGKFPGSKGEALFEGWASDAEAKQDLFDSYSRRVEPSAVLTGERLERWLGV